MCFGHCAASVCVCVCAFGGGGLSSRICGVAGLIHNVLYMYTTVCVGVMYVRSCAAHQTGRLIYRLKRGANVPTDFSHSLVSDRSRRAEFRQTRNIVARAVRFGVYCVYFDAFKYM